MMTACLLFEGGEFVSQFVHDLLGSSGSATLQDLDEFEIGGLLSWKDPVDFSEVTHYNVTWLAQLGLGWVGLLVGLGWVWLDWVVGWLLLHITTSHLTWFLGSYWIMQYPMNL